MTELSSNLDTRALITVVELRGGKSHGVMVKTEKYVSRDNTQYYSIHFLFMQINNFCLFKKIKIVVYIKV